MNTFAAHLRAALWWLLPLATLVVLLGLETNWGNALRIRPVPAEPVQPKPVAAALLPDYSIPGGIAARTETVNRTLFNPTRRPPPEAVAVVVKPVMKKGQFALTGTTVAGDRSLAFLKETAGGKARTVKQGDTINGLLVAEVKPDRVRLTQADDFEEVVLKVSTNPRPTPQPVVAPTPPAGQPARPGQPAGSPGQPGQPVVPPVAPEAAAGQEQAQTLAERRRAARAAEAAAAASIQQNSGQAAAGSDAQPPQAPPAGAAAPAEAGWGAVYQRYQQRRNN